MSNVTTIKPPTTAKPARLTPAEVQTLVRCAKAVIKGARVCIDHSEDVDAYAMEIAEELLDRIDDELDFMSREGARS